MNEMKKEIKKEQEIENKIKKEHEMEREIERTVSDSRVETVHMVRPNHMNAAGRLFGGQLMQWLDEVAGLVAKRHIRGNVITASVDNLRFIHGAYQGEMDCHHWKSNLCRKFFYGSAGGYLCGASFRRNALSN